MFRRQFSVFLIVAAACVLFAAAPAFASGGSGCGSGGGCNGCMSDVMYQMVGSGAQIITAIFTVINGVLAKVEQSFFNGIVKASSFQQMIYVGALLYVAMYGIIITFNLGNYSLAEISGRLIKVTFVLMMTAPGAWTSFNTWVNQPVVGTINQMIQEFTVTAEGGSAITVIVPSSASGASSGSGAATNGLNAQLFGTMFGSSMTTILSVRLAAAILAVAQTGFFGWLIAIFMLWAVVVFVQMLLEAIITYAKCIIGLAFLFAIAPLMFIFLIFDRTKPVFDAWVGEVVTFMLQPILLFAFLSFYVALINQCVPYLLTDSFKAPTDFCWTKWFSIPGSLWDMFILRPTYQNGVWTLQWADGSGNTLPTPINVPNALYFLMLCYLGRAFSKVIPALTFNLGQGIGGGTAAKAPDLTSFASKGIGAAAKGISNGASMVGRR